jgi:hypothetical protein
VATGASSDKAHLDRQEPGSDAWGTSKSSFPLSATQQHLRLRRVAVEFGAALLQSSLGRCSLEMKGRRPYSTAKAMPDRMYNV